MDDGAAGTSWWSLERSVGTLMGGTLAGSIDVAHPELGFRDLQVEGLKLAGRWFCVLGNATPPGAAGPPSHDAPSWPLSIFECYARGVDLVAAYRATNDWPYSPQIYWRARSLDAVEGVVGSLSLLVSVQTHLLDTCPRISVDSQFNLVELVRLSANQEERSEAVRIERDALFQPGNKIECVIRRFSDAPISYAEFMPASDFRELRAGRQWGGGDCVRWELFGEFLEKGVIRRARLHGAFLRREHDVDIATACCDVLQRDTLPLTT
jgi:hypothetical protein